MAQGLRQLGTSSLTFNSLWISSTSCERHQAMSVWAKAEQKNVINIEHDLGIDLFTYSSGHCVRGDSCWPADCKRWRIPWDWSHPSHKPADRWQDTSVDNPSGCWTPCWLQCRTAAPGRGRVTKFVISFYELSVSWEVLLFFYVCYLVAIAYNCCDCLEIHWFIYILRPFQQLRTLLSANAPADNTIANAIEARAQQETCLFWSTKFWLEPWPWWVTFFYALIDVYWRSCRPHAISHQSISNQ